MIQVQILNCSLLVYQQALLLFFPAKFSKMKILFYVTVKGVIGILLAKSGLRQALLILGRSDGLAQ